MKVSKEELKAYNLFDSLPDKLKNLEAGKFFVFFYDVDEENVKLKIYEYFTAVKINVSLYKGIFDKIRKYGSETMSLGVFSSSFDTKDGLFYLLLKTYNDDEKVSLFYSNIIEQERMVDIVVSTDCINSIYNSEDFSRSISYFCPNRMQTIKFVYDMVNDAFEQKLSKRLYGDMIKKVVNMVKYDAGIMPEINGEFRFMVIGEKANLTEEQTQRLEEAKMLSRSNIDLIQIYTRTGWALSSLDGKWRTNISDEESVISEGLLYDFNGRKLYIPKGQDAEDVMRLVANPDNIYKSKYKGVLSDVLNHPTLYKYYPELALLPIVYYFGDTPSKQGKFYFSQNKLGGFILINGAKNSGNPLSILLHEIQHKIQNVEGFATGGNQLFAQFVASVGSATVRKIFACLNKIERYFKDNMINEESRLKLKEILIEEIPVNKKAEELKYFINQILDDASEYDIKYKQFCFYLVLFIAEQGDLTTNNFVIYLVERLGDFVYDLVENVADGYVSQKSWVEKLQEEGGYSEEDISIIRFKNYENLYGEIESRSVQYSRLVEGMYKNYFYLEKWDMSPISKITVIDGKEEVLETGKIVAAVEKKDDEYVLHFNRTSTSLPFLHELGHIVHDALVTLGKGDVIKEEFEKQFLTEFYTDESEYFVSKFLGYLKKNIDDADMRQDMRLDFSINNNEKIDAILDDFFADRGADERLTYLQTILSLI